MNHNNFVLKIICIVFVFFIVLNISYTQDTIPFFWGDTINFYKAVVFNDRVKCENYDDMELIKPNFFFTGYLILKFDSNTIYERFSPRDSVYSLKAQSYWVQNIDEINVDSCKYYYYPNYRFLSTLGRLAYYNGGKDDLSTFFFYLYVFNQPCLSRGLKEYVNFLYEGNGELITDSLLNSPILIKEDGKKMYVIFKTKFQAAIVQFKSTGKKILIPTSILLNFEPLSEDSYVFVNKGEAVLKNLGFKRVYPNIRIINK